MGFIDRFLGKSSEEGTQVNEIDDMIASSYANKDSPVEEPTFEVNPEPVKTMTEAPVSANIDWVDQGSPSDVAEQVSWDIPDFEKPSSKPSKPEPVIDVMGDAKLKKPFTSELWEKGEETPSEQWSKREEKKEEEKKEEEKKEEKKEEEKKEEKKEEEKKEEKKEEGKKEEKKEEGKKEEKKEEKKETKSTGEKSWWEKKGQTFKTNVFGTPSEDIDYARRGGYEGASKEELEINIKSLSGDNATLQQQLAELDRKLDAAKIKRDAIKDRWESEPKGAKKTELYDDLQQQNTVVKMLESDRSHLVQRIRDNNAKLEASRKAISAYERAVKAQREKESRLKKTGKAFSEIAKGTKEVLPSGTEKLTAKDWFGPKGFMSQPYGKRITQSPLEPIKTSSRGLQNITGSTGKSVGRDLMDISQMKPSKAIAPLGVPGTVAGARQQFDYNIPAKKISLLEVSGIKKGGNINPDILPSVYSSAPQPSITQYKQVMQPDGSVVNVPVPVQQRKPKLFTVSVNRYAHRAQVNGLKSDLVSRGVKSVDTTGLLRGVGNFNPTKSAKPSNKVSRGISSVGSIKLINNLNGLKGFTGKDGMGPSRTIKPMSIGARPEIDLGLISAKSLGMKVRHQSYREQEPIIETGHAEDRKSKKSSPLAKIAISMTGVTLNKNLKKYVVKNKTK